MDEVVGLGDAAEEDVLQQFDCEGTGQADEQDLIPFDGGIDAGEKGAHGQKEQQIYDDVADSLIGVDRHEVRINPQRRQVQIAHG